MAPQIDTWLASEIGEGVSARLPAFESDAAIDLAVGRIRFHGLSLVLCDTTETLQKWPLRLREAVLEEAQMQAMWEESHRRMLRQLFDAFAEHGVQAVVMKGTALAYSVYSNPAWRRRGDSDILICESRLEDARRILRANDFSLSPPPHGLLFQESWYFDTGIGFEHVVDLHWRVVDSPRLQTVLGADDMLENSIPLPRLHSSAWAADPVRALVQGAFNQCEHSISGYAIEGEKVPEGDRLIWAMDYRYLCRTLDDEQWQELVRLAERHKISTVIRAALDQARSLSEECVPEPVFAELADRQQGGKVMSYLTQASRRRRIASDLAASRGVGDKVSYVLRLMLPNDDHLRSTFPHARNSPKFLLRLRWLVRAMFRHLKPDSA